MKRIVLLISGFIFIFMLMPSKETLAADSAMIGEIVAEETTEEITCDSLLLFEKEYRVVVDTVSIRTAPDESAETCGVLYKDDIVYVKSIKNGWVGFKKQNVWRYIPEYAVVRNR